MNKHTLKLHVRQGIDFGDIFPLEKVTSPALSLKINFSYKVYNVNYNDLTF